MSLPILWREAHEAGSVLGSTSGATIGQVLFNHGLVQGGEHKLALLPLPTVVARGTKRHLIFFELDFYI